MSCSGPDALSLDRRVRGVLFDLDQTLVDSQVLAPLRESRAWARAYARTGELSLYPGLARLLARMERIGIPVGVVTSSPRPYFERVAGAVGLVVAGAVCYHDAPYRKPHPAPILAGAALIGLRPNEVAVVGDLPSDIIAAQRAGAVSIAALWGAVDASALDRALPDHRCRTVGELDQLLGPQRTRSGLRQQ